LVQWKGQHADEATWEDVILLKSQFPKFCLEDKTIFSETVGPRVWRVYSRRGKKVNVG
jgi:hypothetical protein